MSTKLQTKVQANTTPTFTPVLQKPRTSLSDSSHHILQRRDHHEPIVQEPGQPVPGTPAFIDPRFGHDFSRVRIYDKGAVRNPPIQAKLRINKPGDVYEEEADRVAEQVMRMEEPGVQRQVEEEETLQAKEIPSQIPEVTPNLEAGINTIRGGGQPLPESTRAFFEPRFGHDFSQVRVHTDAKAAEAARAVNAWAFTVGQDVVFGAGEYAPGTNTGQRLMAHELVHLVQQSLSPTSRVFLLRKENESGRKREEQLSKNPQLYQALTIARRGGEGNTFLSTDTITLYAQTIGIEPNQVSWVVNGVSKDSGSGKPHALANQGYFTFRPNPINRPITRSRRVNSPIIYSVEARVEAFTVHFTLQQDETDVLRQEYVDIGATPPTRNQITVPTYPPFNGGNYTIVVDGGMGPAFNAIQGEFENLTQKAGATVAPAISVSSGYRNPRRNVAARSKLPVNSPHLLGRALDLTVVGTNARLWRRLRQAGANAGCISLCECGPKVVPCSDPGVDHVHIQWATPPPTYIEFETQHLVGVVPRTGPVSVEKTSGFTRRHKELMKRQPIPAEKVERFGEWDVLKMQWERMTSPEGISAFLADYKDRWVRVHRYIIKAAAREYTIPDWVLAGVAWTEVGGEPPWTDDLSYILGDLGIHGKPEKASYGPVAIQIQRAAEELGYDPAILWSVQMSYIIHSLRKPQENLFIVASHLLRCKNVSSPAKPPDMLTDFEISILGARYNRGVELSEEALLILGQKTKYGDDLVKKKERMKRLLED